MFKFVQSILVLLKKSATRSFYMPGLSTQMWLRLLSKMEEQANRIMEYVDSGKSLKEAGSLEKMVSGKFIQYCKPSYVRCPIS